MEWLIFYQLSFLGGEGGGAPDGFQAAPLCYRHQRFGQGFSHPGLLITKHMGTLNAAEAPRPHFSAKNARTQFYRIHRNSNFCLGEIYVVFPPPSPMCIYAQAQVTPKYTSAVLLGTVSA